MEMKSTDIKVGVIFPSRGLAFSKTAEELLKNFSLNLPYKIFFSHRKPIPACFEEPTLQALKDPDITHLWFVEDDMILHPNILWDMLTEDAPVVTCDYPIEKNGRGAVFEVKGEVIFAGTGCTLVEREVFDVLTKPYFRADIRWNIMNYGKYLKMIGNKHNPKLDPYGMHDVTFGVKLYLAGIPIKVLDQTLGQRKLIELGKVGTNNGAHNIEEWKKTRKNVFLKEVRSWPVLPSGNLITVTTPTGNVETSATHAKKLIRENLATKLVERPVVIDDSDVKL